MKTKKWTSLTTCAWLSLGLAFGQEVESREQFKLTSERTTITLEKGSIDSVELVVLRARKFKGMATVTLNSTVPKGMLVNIEAVPGKPDHFMLFVLASLSVDNAEFYLIPSCQVNGLQKGIAVRVTVKENINCKTL